MDVVAVPVTKVLHLKSAVTALPDGTIVGRTANVDDPGAFPDFLEVPEEHGTAVVDLGDGALLMSSDAPRRRRAVPRAWLRGGDGADHGVREARGLRDLPVGARPALAGTVTTRENTLSHRILARRLTA